jgi:general secretion pathway protein G
MTARILSSANRRPAASRTSRGFTLLELMIVITIILILATMSAVRYEQSLVLAREAALRQNLSVMRTAINNYTLDKEEAPTSLDDLHTAQYIGDVPIDPFTHQKDWVTDSCTDVLSPDQVAGGICDVHSASNSVSVGGEPYNQF